MTAKLILGKQLAIEIKQQVKHAVKQNLLQGKSVPGLAVILLGNDPASSIYVANKRKSCIEVGFNSWEFDLPYETTEHSLVTLINELNHREDVHGILVQLPLPNHIKANKILETIKPSKDVDGFHPYNLGRLAQGNPLIRPCTPYGVIQLLNHYKLDIAGRNVVVVGASNIVGRPMALEFLLAKATVTICHKHTKNLEQHVRSADIIIVATGVYNLIDPFWLNESQIVVDIGIHRNDNGEIYGDMNFIMAERIVNYITPVPGGIGPMTIATLLQNTLLAANLQD